MAVSNVNIYYPSAVTPVTGVLVPQTTSAYDLRKIILWNSAPIVGTTNCVSVLFDQTGTARPAVWPRDEFFTAKQASLDAGG